MYNECMKRTVLLYLAAGTLFLAGCSKEEEPQVFTGEMSDGLWQYSEVSAESPVILDAHASGEWTLSFWIRPLNSEPEAVVLFCGEDDDYWLIAGREFNAETASFSGVSLQVRDGETFYSANAEEGLPTRQWTMISVRVSGRKTELYINGDPAAQIDHACRLDHALRFGENPLDLGNVYGRLGEVRIDRRDGEELKRAYILAGASVLLDRAEYPDQGHLRRSLWFDSNFIDDIPVFWTVENNDVMNYLGQITDHTKDADVTAHARIDLPESHAEKTFVFRVLGDTPEILFAEDCAALDRTVQGVMSSGSELPGVMNGRTEITYEVTEGAHIADGILVKDSAEERLPVTLKAHLSDGERTAERTYSLVLLDEAYAYLMTYFNGDAGEEKGYIAVSTDGLTWEKISGVTITGDVYSVRDPHVNRRKDGGFVVTATASGDTPFIQLWESEDMITFNGHRNVLVGYPDKGIRMSGTKAWAPDLYYDRESGLYWIYFSDPSEEYGPVFAVTSEDLETFSYPVILFDPQYPVIDASLFVMDGRYWLVYKDERKPAQTVYSAVGDSLGDNIFRTYDYKHLILERAVEGPVIFRDINTGEYHLYVDRFSDHTFLAGRFTGLDYDHEVDWSDTKHLSLPEADVRHGSVTIITEKEYRNLRGTE